MEAHLASQEPLMIDNLNCVPSHSVDYVVGRKKATFFASGSNIYSTTGGTRVLKISLNSSSDWVDPSCVYLFCLVNNEGSGSKRIRPISNGHLFFRRLRVMAGNGILEDINDYNKVAELFENVMKPDQERENDDVEGFGYHHGDGVTADPSDTNGVQQGGKQIHLSDLFVEFYVSQNTYA